MQLGNMWENLWQMHDETKTLFSFSRQAKVENLKERNLKKDVNPTSTDPEGEPQREYKTYQKAGLFLGLILFIVVLAMPTPAGMTLPAQRMLATAFLMACWWMCESIPIPATGLIPLVLYPILGILPIKKATASYGSWIIFLVMGGFLIAMSMQRWNLHKRIAMHIVNVIGFSPGRMILGFMVATATLSAFVSNTSTTVMMTPIAISIITLVVEEGKKEGLDKHIDFSPENFNFGLNLMLGIAYSASIGGMATLIGTPANAVLASYFNQTYGLEITFMKWMMVGVPMAVIMLPLSWYILTKFVNPIELQKLPGGREIITSEIREMGPMNKGEKWTLLVFSITVFFWIFRKNLGFLFLDASYINDAVIAMAGGLVLFLLPVDIKKNQFCMDWKTALKMPWGVLILVGGGLSLAGGFKATNLADWIGSQVTLLQGAPFFVIMLVVTVVIILLTELTSNTATAAMIMPILAAMAVGLGQNPLLLAVPATLAASCAFMLPVATHPNAIIFGSGYVRIPQMVRSGATLNLLGVIVVLALVYTFLMPVFDVTFGQLPAWIK